MKRLSHILDSRYVSRRGFVQRQSSALDCFSIRKQYLRYDSWLAATAISVPQDDFFSTKNTNKTIMKKQFLPPQYRTPRKCEQYILGKELGKGMFSKVYQAVCKNTGRHVAVKVMDKHTTPKELCEREVRILEQVTEQKVHSRINTIFDAYETDSSLFIVLELMAGDLFDYVAESGRLSEPDAASVTRKLCYALDALHRSGILHRDIKLENLLIEKREMQPGSDVSNSKDSRNSSTGTDDFKLADFGFAKRIDEKDQFRNPAGTLGYAAPEVLEHRKYGPACDVWSAGVVLYIMLSGHPPFPTSAGIDPATLLEDEKFLLELEAIHYGREVMRWTEHLEKGAWKNVSLPAKILVSKMLRIDPERRYTTTQVLNDPWIRANTNQHQYEYLNFE